jgi:hypothetical protein
MVPDGGRLWAESPGPGQGPTFFVVLPACPEGRLEGETKLPEGSMLAL